MRAASLTRLVMAAVACSTLTLPASAAAQWARDRDGGWQNDRGWENRSGGEAYQRGFRDGERLGEDDERRNRAFNAQSHREYREADEGYDRNDGSRDRYRDEYRRGFTEGYRLGYRDDRWDRNDRRGDNGTWNRGGYRDPGPGARLQRRLPQGRRGPARQPPVRAGTIQGSAAGHGARLRRRLRFARPLHVQLPRRIPPRLRGRLPQRLREAVSGQQLTSDHWVYRWKTQDSGAAHQGGLPAALLSAPVSSTI